MERLESIGTALSQITLYDIKSMYNQAKNVVLNVSEMEAKVREATNEDPWGASSSLMQEIATGTFNFQNFNEIMPCIYARFMEKEARQWRQIYKALQLLEYLVKNGSERVVDDARSHISTLKMLRNFHYIDEKGKDEGLNVRNRSRELVELLSDVEKIRAERRKSKANKHRYTGTGNDALSFSSSDSRYGGFGGDTFNGGSYDREYGGYSGGGSGSSGGGGGGSSSRFRDDNRRSGFQEYDAGEDEISTSRRSNSISQRNSTSNASTAPAKAKEPVKEVNLLDGLDDDDNGLGGLIAPPQTEKALPTLGNQAVSLDDDDFTDFVAAPPSQKAAGATSAGLNLMDLLNATPTSNVSRPLMPTHTSSASLSQPSIPAMANNTANFGFSGVMSPTSPTAFGQRNTLQPQPSTPTVQTAFPPTPAAQTKPAGGFEDLWTMSLGSASTANKVASPKMMDLQKEKATAGIWGTAKPQTQGSGASFGSFGMPASNANQATSGGGDDLLL